MSLWHVQKSQHHTNKVTMIARKSHDQKWGKLHSRFYLDWEHSGIEQVTCTISSMILWLCPCGWNIHRCFLITKPWNENCHNSTEFCLWKMVVCTSLSSWLVPTKKPTWTMQHKQYVELFTLLPVFNRRAWDRSRGFNPIGSDNKICVVMFHR